ncbi:MAG: DNA translocase FtsK 4TM domain-containing protein, partial [Oscillospiraceae bacterium]|nr:DNA translocase FtsK 4TM domain-containing protein [Oscillospiraceae bacterium]
MAGTKKTSTAKKTSSSKRPTKAELEAKQANDKVLWSTVLFAAGILIAAFAAVEGESAWYSVHNLILGLFGIATVLVPVILIYASIMIASDKTRATVAGKVIQGIILILICCAVIQIFFAEPFDENVTLGKIISDLYENGKAFRGGGFFSIVIGVPLIMLFGKTGAAVIVVLLAFVFAMLMANKTVVDIFRFIKNIFAAADAARPEYEEVEEFVPPPGARQQKKKPSPTVSETKNKPCPNSDVPQPIAEEKRKDFNIDIPLPFGKKKDKTADVTVSPENEPAAPAETEKPKSAVELEADAIAKSIEAQEAEKQAARNAVKTEAAEKPDDDIESIIKKAVTKPITT